MSLNFAKLVKKKLIQFMRLYSLILPPHQSRLTYLDSYPPLRFSQVL